MKDPIQRRHPAARPPYKQPQRLDGAKLCRWCWGEIPKFRRTFCCQDCVQEFLLITDWNVAVRHVGKRDRGVCASCGVDTYWLQAACKALYDYAYEEEPRWWRIKPEGWRYTRLGELAHRLIGRNFIGQPWECDHIRARADGGDHHPFNLRTICHACHRARTAQQHRERAAQRRAKGGT